jgi:hypothetical protein
MAIRSVIAGSHALGACTTFFILYFFFLFFLRYPNNELRGGRRRKRDVGGLGALCKMVSQGS